MTSTRPAASDRPGPSSSSGSSIRDLASTCQRVLVPLTAGSEQQQVLLPATVLASWFNAPIQIICDNPDLLPDYQALAAGLGVAVEPVLCLQDEPVDGLVAHANSQAPSIIVTEASLSGLRIAARASQPVLLAASRFAHRVPVGPLAVEITGSEADTDALALAAVLATALDESVRLVVTVDENGIPDDVSEALADAEQRLTRMGCDVGVDRLEADEPHSLVLVGRTRETTAIIVPQVRLQEPGMIEEALRQGVNVLIAPSGDKAAGRAAPFAPDLTRQQSVAPDGAKLGVLDREQCRVLLQDHSIARLGYIDAGWPTVVPINYRVKDGDIFIRTLAGGKLRAAERKDTVCLELDGYDEMLRSGWSVVAHGVLEIIADAATLSEAWANDPQPWVAADDWQWLRMMPFSISGREVLPGRAD